MSEKSYDRIKNFSTEIPVSRTVAEIEKMLTKYGATHIMKEYNGEIPVMLVFAITTEHGKMGVRLPIHPDRVLSVFKLQVNNRLLPNKYWDGEWAIAQAHRVAWRIVKDWLDAQLTLLNIQMVKIEEIFLPYIYNDKLKMTVYEMLEKNKFNLEMLEAHNGNSRLQ
jgi:hypothetical protein